MIMRRATVSFLALVIAIALVVSACKFILVSESSRSVVAAAASSSSSRTTSHFNTSSNSHHDWDQQHQEENEAMQANHPGHDRLRGSYQGDSNSKTVVVAGNDAAEHGDPSTEYERNLHHLNNMCLFHGPELFVGDPPPYPEILLVNFTTIHIVFEFSFEDNITQSPDLEEMRYFMENTRRFFIDYMLSPYLQPRPLHEDFDEFTLSLLHCKQKPKGTNGFPLRIAADATVYYDLLEDPLHRPMTEADVVDAIIDSFQWDDYVKDYLWRDSEEGRASVWNRVNDVFFSWKVVHEDVHPQRHT